MRLGLYATADVSALLKSQDIPFSGVDEYPCARFASTDRASFLHRVGEAVFRGESIPAELLVLHLSADALPGNVLRRYVEWQLNLSPYLRKVDAPCEGDGFFLLGDDLLICPLSDEGAVDALLPPGLWTDMMTGETISGHFRRLRSPNAMPILAREGAVIPTGDERCPTLHWYQPPEDSLGLMYAGPHRLILHRDGTETLLRT